MKKNLVLKQWMKILCLFFIVFAGNAVLGFAGVDCWVTAWSPPSYDTPDIWVDNNGNGVQECEEPLLGKSDNLLQARIRNQGSDAAAVGTVFVSFYFAPYGMGYGPADLTHFKLIDTVTVSAPIPAGGSRISGVDWDLSDLSYDHGGVWGGHQLGEFDHFCVRVVVECTGDTNPANNSAQKNFASVTCSDCGFNFLIANPTENQVTARLVTTGLPEGWRQSIVGCGIKDVRDEFTLAPNEIKKARMTFAHPDDAGEKDRTINIGLTLDGKPAGGLTFKAVTSLPEKLYKYSFSFHVGGAIPVGPGSATWDPGGVVFIDFDYHSSRRLSTVLLLGYNRFRAATPLVGDTHWWNISVNLKQEFILSPEINFFLKGGPGAYIPRNGSIKAGANVGFGWNYKLSSACRLEFGSDYHHIFKGSKTRFIVTHAGVVFYY